MSNDAMVAANLAAGEIIKTPVKKRSKASSGRQGSILPPSKTRHEVVPQRRGFWHGVMTAKLREQERGPTFDGFYRCQCGDPDCEAQVEGFDEAREFFIPGHLKPRSEFRSRGFRFGHVASLGPDDPNNIVPVSPDCNRREFWRRQR